MFLFLIKGKYCEIVGRQCKVFRNLIRFAMSFPRASTSQRPVVELRVYENSDSLRTISASFLHWDRKSVQPICHALHVRKKNSCDCCVTIATLQFLLWIICHNSVATLYKLTYKNYNHVYVFRAQYNRVYFRICNPFLFKLFYKFF